PRALVGFRRTLAQRVHAAVHVRVVRPLLLEHRVEHDVRALRRRRVVEVRERLAVDVLRETGEAAPERADVRGLAVLRRLSDRYAHSTSSQDGGAGSWPARSLTARSRSR